MLTENGHVDPIFPEIVIAPAGETEAIATLREAGFDVHIENDRSRRTPRSQQEEILDGEMPSASRLWAVAPPPF